MTVDTEFKQAFLEEGYEHIATLSNSVIELEKSPDDRDVIDAMFRAAHTLKSSAMAMGYQHFSELCHRTEDLMDLIRKKKMNATSAIIDVLLEAVDLMQDMADNIEAHDAELDASAIIAKIEAKMAQRSDEAPDAAPRIPEPERPAEDAAAEAAPAKVVQEVPAESPLSSDAHGPYEVGIDLKDAELPAARAFIILNNLDALGVLLDTVPGREEIETGNITKIILKIAPDSESFSSATAFLGKNNDVSFSVLKGPSEALETPEKAADDAADAREQKDVDVPQAPEKAQKKQDKKITDTVRVKMSILDSMMSLTGELVIGKMRLIQLSKRYDIPELSEAVSMFERTITDLQTDVMGIRMLPVDTVFSRFPRMIRDLAKNRNKEIEFTIKGGDVEVDRTVIDEMYDPLMHLLRNAADHGIELPEEREKAGKPRKGTIILSAVRERNSILIEVRDDGKGIDPENVRRAAVKKGTITEEEAQQIADKDAINLILRSGISTAKEITDTSGRGVGMDVVVSRLKALGGNVVIETEKGGGTTMKILLPITLAIMMAIMVEVNGEAYAVPLRSVNEIIKVREGDVKKVLGTGEVIVLRNEIIPLIKSRDMLHTFVNGESEMHFAATRESDVLILEVNGKKQGLVVDSVIGQEEIVVRPLDALMKGLRNVSGATIRGDGTIAFIIDI